MARLLGWGLLGTTAVGESWLKRLASRTPAAIRYALALSIVFGVAHGVGLRSWVSLLSGTPVLGVPTILAGWGAVLYVLSYFSAILLAPILVLATMLSAIGELAWGPRKNKSAISRTTVRLTRKAPGSRNS